ncbi:MAG: molybdopterin-binding protein [Paracoccaceae bacterium]|nr:molybdopterin-binding protein [Paracoccaceae bacterium]
MTQFDTIAVVDWSGGNDTGPKPRKDAIWLGVVRKGETEKPLYLRNRAVAETALVALIAQEQAAGRRLLIGFDFPFAYPRGFAQALIGQADPLALWDWLEARITDEKTANNRFDLAAEINRSLGGKGPFWGNALGRDIVGLGRTKKEYSAAPFPEKRRVETLATGSFSCWQLAGAGAVGSQVLMGLPVLSRLRRRFADDLAVWPFESSQKSNAAVVLAEIWPSLISGAVRQAQADGGIRDAHQVRLLAVALSQVVPEKLRQMMAVETDEEGWILGQGFETDLEAAALRLQPPPLRNDCFALPAGVDWTPVEIALSLLRDRMQVVKATVNCPSAQAQGRILATPVSALRSNPPEANTAVDGYGFDYAATGAGTQVLPLVAGRAAAGAPFAGKVPAGHAVRMLTGAALPDGVDTVVLDEDVTASTTHIAFRGPLKRGANTRQAGEDIVKGAVALPAGRLLTPADLALLSAVGCAQVPVRKRLRVAVLSTGDELLEAGQVPGPGQIFDANRPMLLSLATRWGFEPVDLGRVGDDRDALRAAFDQGAAQADVILTSGGASAGDEDHVSALLRASGALQMWRIALKPGRPLALAMWQGVPVFGLPGNPVAALVCALVFARPAMAALSGQGWIDPQGYEVPAGFEKQKRPGRHEYLRARVRDGRVEAFGSEGSGRISGLSWAEGLVELDSAARHIRPGDLVRYLPFGSFGM